MAISRLLVACLCLGSFAPAQTPLFQALDNSLPADIQTGGDLDGDGIVDLVVPGGVLLNDGHGRFSLVAVPSLAFFRCRTELADLNGDGSLDLIASSCSLTPLRTYLNGGGFVFTQAQVLALGAAGSNLIPVDFAAGDVDGDGDVDILVGMILLGPYPMISPAPPVLWLNNGAGILTLAPSTSVPGVAVPAQEVRLHDLDGDGDLDAIFADVNAYSGLWTSTNTGGVFTLSAAPLWPGALVSFEIGKLNSDALPDFVVAIGGSAAVILNSPGGFLAPVISPRPGAWAYATADLNGDGVDELLETAASTGLTVNTVVPGGTFGATTQSWTDLRTRGLYAVDSIVQDLDGDGDRDVVAFRSNEAMTLMNGGNGTLVRIGGRVTNIALTSSNAQHVIDLDADGDSDVLGYTENAAGVATGLNDGDGFFGAGPTSTLSPAPGPHYYSLHPFDRDGDGDADLYATLEMGGAPGPPPGPDLVYDNAGGVYTLFAAVPSTGDARGFQSADFDGDGDQDVVMGRWRISSTPAGPMVYVSNLGAAGFTAPAPIGTSHHNYDLDLADFDGNGTLDVFQTNKQTFASPIDPCVIYLSSGTGAFTAVTVTGVSGWFAAAGDLNGDGLADVVVDGQVLFSAGAGTFVPGTPLPSALVGPATLVDVDLDGDLDLVETPATVMLNLGGGTFAAPVSSLPRISAVTYDTEIPQSGVVDVDRDGDPDIVAPGPLVLMNTTRQLAHGSVPRPGRPGSIDLYGTPGGAWFLYVSNGTTSFPYGAWGNVLIDPASAQLGAMGTFAGPAAPLPGTASFGITLPNNPALVGWTTYWQAIDPAQTHFTNRLTITVMGY